MLALLDRQREKVCRNRKVHREIFFSIILLENFAHNNSLLNIDQRSDEAAEEAVKC